MPGSEQSPSEHMSEEFQIFLEKVRSLDLGPIAYQLTQSRLGPHWTQAKAVKAIARYLAFLYLAERYSRLQLAPSRDIDTVWHYHILDTSKYAEDCEMLFGRLIHHFPYLGSRDEADKRDLHQAYALTQVLFRKHFGIELVQEEDAVADCEPLLAGVLCAHSRCVQASAQRPTVDISVVDALLIFPVAKTCG